MNMNIRSIVEITKTTILQMTYIRIKTMKKLHIETNSWNFTFIRNLKSAKKINNRISNRDLIVIYICDSHFVFFYILFDIWKSRKKMVQKITKPLFDFVLIVFERWKCLFFFLCGLHDSWWYSKLPSKMWWWGRDINYMRIF